MTIGPQISLTGYISVESIPSCFSTTLQNEEANSSIQIPNYVEQDFSEILSRVNLLYLYASAFFSYIYLIHVLYFRSSSIRFRHLENGAREHVARQNVCKIAHILLVHGKNIVFEMTQDYTFF